METEALKIRSMEELGRFTAAAGHARQDMERLIAGKRRFWPVWMDGGFCEACGKDTFFISDWRHSDGKAPNFRERMFCRRCGLNSRQRLAAGFVRKFIDGKNGKAGVYLYEQATKFYRFVNKNRAGAKITGSEYLGHGIPGGKVIRGLRHEDAMNLSLGTETMDLIVSNDVYEHVPDAGAAFGEACRVLRPGGVLFFSIPFHPDREDSGRRASLEGGVVRNILQPQYHGNPISLKGSLVFHDFGWDIIKKCLNAGFGDAYALVYYSVHKGYLGGNGQIVFVAEKRIKGQNE